MTPGDEVNEWTQQLPTFMTSAEITDLVDQAMHSQEYTPTTSYVVPSPVHASESR